MKFDLKKIESELEVNFKERLDFVKFWAEYIKSHSDKEWSLEQKELIDSQVS
jgi:hypothetical protein